MPKVSVILTSYNHAQYLRAAIDSALAQTFTDFELFIWDDASSDQSWEIIQSYGDARIRAIRNESRRRPIFGINRVISEMAAGEYIAIHHSDDIWEPGKLDAQVRFLDTHPTHGAVFTNALIIDERGKPSTERTNSYFSIFAQPNRSRYEWLHFFFFRGNGLCHPSVLIRKAFFDQYGLYRRGFSQLTDYDTWIRLCMHYEIHVLPEKLVQFRVPRENINASSPTPEGIIRTEFEMFRVLDNYLQLSEFEEIAAIFPEAGKYRSPRGFDQGYVLGMVAVEAKASSQTVLFGLNLLFEALGGPARAERLKALYDFDAVRFHEIKGSSKVFCHRGTVLGWRLLQLLRGIRFWLAPTGSTREKLWYAAYDGVKARL